MDPDQSVSLWRAIGKPVTIPIHWGVFELADESLDEPPQSSCAPYKVQEKITPAFQHGE